MNKAKHSPLQLFAEGSAAGEGGVQGETGAVAGHTGLQGSPVPADGQKLRANPAQPGQQDAAAEAQAQRRLTWEEIKADPEYSREMQLMVQQRLKKAKTAQENMTKLEPVLAQMARTYGMDPENPDYDALAKAVTANVSTQADRRAARERVMQRHYQSLLQQSRSMEKKYPGFDLRKEMKNPVFVRLVSPNGGVSVEDAYYTVHRREIGKAAMQVAAQRAARQISNAIHSGMERPRENGTSSHGPSVTAFDYRTASREQRDALKQRIRQAGARGEKIYPGEY